MSKFETITDARIEKIQTFKGDKDKPDRYRVQLSMRGSRNVTVWTDLQNLREGQEGEAKLTGQVYKEIERVTERNGNEYRDMEEFERYTLLSAFNPLPSASSNPLPRQPMAAK